MRKVIAREALMTYFVQAHEKIDGRMLWLFSQRPREYIFTNDLPETQSGDPTRRWHDLRGEWVYYNGARNDRTYNPPAKYNPLAPVQPDGYPGEIPVTDFEVAVFDNRFPALRHGIDSPGVDLPASGHCEVVVYSKADNGSLADYSDDHVALLIDAWGHRVDYLLNKDTIFYAMPFENRGSQIGVTLPHPHGQIYAFSHTPPIIERQAMRQAKSSVIERQLDKKNLRVTEHGRACTLVPEFARYPFESWILSEECGPSPSSWGSSRLDMARALKASVARLDRLFGEPMPLTMWIATAPKGYEDNWPCHIQIYPFLRGPKRLKYLASVEQMTGLMLSDVLPETAAAKL
ncbi:MAG: galactose-1-phosphate uridylyltransferase, partial [Alphaproteobacteria bacterium]